MKMLKKLVLTTVAVALVLSVFSCKKDDDDDDYSAPLSTTDATATLPEAKGSVESPFKSTKYEVVNDTKTTTFVFDNSNTLTITVVDDNKAEYDYDYDKQTLKYTWDTEAKTITAALQYVWAPNSVDDALKSMRLLFDDDGELADDATDEEQDAYYEAKSKKMYDFEKALTYKAYNKTEAKAYYTSFLDKLSAFVISIYETEIQNLQSSLNAATTNEEKESLSAAIAKAQEELATTKASEAVQTKAMLSQIDAMFSSTFTFSYDSADDLATVSFTQLFANQDLSGADLNFYEKDENTSLPADFVLETSDDGLSIKYADLVHDNAEDTSGRYYVYTPTITKTTLSGTVYKDGINKGTLTATYTTTEDSVTLTFTDVPDAISGIKNKSVTLYFEPQTYENLVKQTTN